MNYIDLLTRKNTYDIMYLIRHGIDRGSYISDKQELKMQEIIIRSSLDNTDQPSLFYFAGEGRPLLVGLHTWSYDRANQIDNMLPYAKEYGWNLLLPEFRGPNTPSNPECRKACGSPYAIRDIFDAIEYVCENYKADKNNIFMLGLSGGGHMALLAAANNPEMFRAVGAFVPITDMKAWHEYSGYRTHIEACLGGAPDECREVYRERSPIYYLDELSRANLKIFHGKFDTVVPFEQSTRLYGALCEKYPKSRVFLDVFDGGHQIDLNAAFYWLTTQYKHENVVEVTG